MIARHERQMKARQDREMKARVGEEEEMVKRQEKVMRELYMEIRIFEQVGGLKVIVWGIDHNDVKVESRGAA